MAWDAIAGIYKTRDRRLVRLHTNFRHHRDAVCRVLNCKPEREEVQAALMQWDGEAFETAAYDERLRRGADALICGMVGAAPRQGAGRIAADRRSRKSARPSRRPWPAGDRPLAGLRVLDLSRVIAGPVAGRTLAAHGADVLLISGPDLPAVPWLTIDTGRGKLTSLVELKSDQGRGRLCDLLASADIFSQGYRPHAIAALGFSPQDAARISPGIVYVSLSAYGHCGPWAERRGYRLAGANGDRLQSRRGSGRRYRRAKGIAGADARSRQRLPDGVRRDDGAGAPVARRRQLACPCVAGADRALVVEPRPPGRWSQDRGLEERRRCKRFIEESASGFGPLQAVRHSAALSATPAFWARPAMPLGSHPPQWPARH